MSKTDIGIDLGTANTVITLGKKGVVLSEPSAIAYHTHTKEVLAVGKRAYQMIGKTPDYIEVIRPLSGGVISDDRMTQYMIREFILQVTGHRLTKPRIIICVPSFITDVEKRAVVEAAMSAGSRKAYLIDEPIAALIGAGVNIGKARGNMVVDIGGGTTDVAIVSMNGIVTSHSVRAAGNTLDQAIIRYMQTKYKLLIGERTAERLKIEMTNLYDPRADVTSWVKGRNLVSGLPEMQEISELEVTKCDASLIDVYLKNLQNGAMGAKTFNTNVSGIQFFMKFLEVKGYIKKVPFYASYYLEKQIPVHHDRSVEEDVYMEIIQNLSQFPEHLRMMFLHLWCVGLRISEVCTLKGDAYYIQNGDCWMKVYQVKMKNYKRVPIPVTLYRLMQVYLKKHPTKKEAYIFRNRKGGAFSKSTFMGQMKKYCSQIGIQNGEYIFKSHDYRHTVATNFYEHGVSIQSIRDYLGHTFEEMTMQYIDYMPRKIAKENDAYFEEEENSLLACMQKGEKHG